MKAYIICILFTLLFTYLAQYNFKKSHKKVGFIFSILAVFIPSFIAGVRQVGVGRDIDNYVAPVLARALKAGSFQEYWNGASYVEVGYRMMIYLISRFSSNLAVSLFFIQLIPCLCTYIFAYKYREKISMTMVMATYLLVWYLRSYTIMRQSIAIGIILIGMIYLNEKRYFKGTIMFLVAILFHNSAILAFPIIPIMYIFNSETINMKKKVTICVLILFALLLLIISYENVIHLLTYNFGLISEKYYNYTISTYSSDIVISYSELLFRGVCLFLGLFLIVLSKNNKKQLPKEFKIYYYFLILEMILYFISFKLTIGERIGYYYRYIGMLYVIPQIAAAFKAKDKIVINTLLISIMFVFWFWKYPIQKNCETYPYKSEVIQLLND